MGYLSNDHDHHSNQQENSHKLYDETGHPFRSFLEIQSKLRQQHDQNFPMDGKLILEVVLNITGPKMF